MFPRSSARKRKPVFYQTGSLDDQKNVTAGCQKRCCKNKTLTPANLSLQHKLHRDRPCLSNPAWDIQCFLQNMQKSYVSYVSANIHMSHAYVVTEILGRQKLFERLNFKCCWPIAQILCEKKPSSTNHLSENDITPQNQTRKPALKNHPKPFERRNLTALDQLFSLDDKVLEFRITGHLARHRSISDRERGTWSCFRNKGPIFVS